MPARSRNLKPNPKQPINPKPHTPPMISSSSSSSSFKTTSLILLMFSLILLTVLSLLAISSSSTWNSPNTATYANNPVIHSIQVVNQFPHDPNAFTQGLLYAGNGSLFESTGLYGQSSVRKVDIQTGKVEVVQEMDSKYFGEGLTLLGEKLFQVTWLTKIGFKYDRNDFSKSEQFTHEMKDGWGLATDGEVLFGSDGTSALYKINPQTMKVIDKHVVKYKTQEVHNLNELEFIKGEVWANVYQTDCIARISPGDGRVLGWILLPQLREGLVASGNHAIDVLNGIAWDSKTNRIFVTGKLWPKLYEIKLRPIGKQFKDGAIEHQCLRQTFFR